jgi:hypothetical protein
MKKNFPKEKKEPVSQGEGGYLAPKRTKASEVSERGYTLPSRIFVAKNHLK